MTNPVTPPPELVQQWLGAYFGTTVTGEVSDVELALATQAACWGADMELEACCEWLHSKGSPNAPRLRAARRPKPLSRKEQALEAIGRLCASVIHDDLKNDAATIRRALEALDD